jgi:glycosyltransferase involved in cell wall biosynthesis
LIVESNPRYITNWLAIRWMKDRHRPVLGWGLGAPKLSKSPTSLQASILRTYIGKLDGIIAYSQTGALEYSRLLGSETKITIARNATSRKPSTPLPLRKAKKNPAEITILYVGRLQKRKKVAELIRAVSRLNGTDNPRLVVVGDGPELLTLQTLANRILPQTLFTGNLQGAELAEQYKKADLFVLPGTGGLAVQEALSFGLPVIVGEADGSRVDVVSRENGWIVPSEDPDGLYRCLAEAMGDLSSLVVMGQESYKIASEKINIENMVDGFLQALEKAI